ncbi:hypothetical protein [Kribbella yunnanensis]|uniref:hypothetical protein n=1 Tax=Kribbella yunnanensis TaxID=190194 RepID=UPI0031D21FDF
MVPQGHWQQSSGEVRAAGELERVAGARFSPALSPWPFHNGAITYGATMIDELTWWQLRPGDRVKHFEYGAGTVDGSGPVWIYVTWDNPDEPFSHHTAAIARYLTRCGVSADGRAEANSLVGSSDGQDVYVHWTTRPAWAERGRDAK